MEYDLVGDGYASPSAFMLPLKGEFVSKAAPVESPLAPAAMAAPNGTRDVVVQVSEYVPNTAAAVYMQAGQLQTSATVPPPFTTALFRRTVRVVRVRAWSK